MLEISDVADRAVLESGEARVLVAGFIYHGQSKEWLKNALRVSRRIYGNDSEERIRTYMKTIWTQEFLMGTRAATAGTEQSK
jgi:hypothetical protein